jgi:hypothetical protein
MNSSISNSHASRGDPLAHVAYMVQYYSDDQMIEMHGNYFERFEEIFIKYISNKRMSDKEISDLLDGDFFKERIVDEHDFLLKLVKELLKKGNITPKEFIIKIIDLNLLAERKFFCLKLVLSSQIDFTVEDIESVLTDLKNNHILIESTKKVVFKAIFDQLGDNELFDQLWENPSLSYIKLAEIVLELIHCNPGNNKINFQRKINKLLKCQIVSGVCLRNKMLPIICSEKVDSCSYLYLYLISCFASDQEIINDFSVFIKNENLLQLKGNLKKIKDLIFSRIDKKSGSILNNNLNLIIASLSGNYEKIQKLLNSDLDIESIHLSALAGIKLNNIEIVKLLITDSRIKDSPDFSKLLLEQDLKNISTEMRDLLNANSCESYEFQEAKRRKWRIIGNAVGSTTIVILNGVREGHFPSWPIMLSPIISIVATESAILLSNPEFLAKIGSRVYDFALNSLRNNPSPEEIGEDLNERGKEEV